jgi:TolB protein
VAGLSLWLAAGVVLVDWAQRQGRVSDIVFSPYHAVGYVALLLLAAYVAISFFRRFRRHGWRGVFPPFYGGLGLGLALLVGFIVLDTVWQNTLGVGFGIEGALVPSRLLVAAAVVVIAAGPVRDALATRAAHPGSALDRRTRWAGVVGVGVLGAALSLTAFNPLRDSFHDWAVEPGKDLTEIWSMAADGSDQRRVVPAFGDGVDYSLPVFSPDGARIAYTVWTNEGGTTQNVRNVDQTAAVWTAAADGSDRRLLVDGAPGQAWIPAWSPDGSWIAYSLSPQDTPDTSAPQPQPGGPGGLGPPTRRAAGSIWVIRPDGTEARPIPAGSAAVAAAWSPDGTMLAYELTIGGNPDIYVGTVADDLADLHPVAEGPSHEWGASWSPDGRHVLFVSDRTGNDEVWIAPAVAGTGEPRQLTENGAGDWVPVFSPDGSRIAFVSDRTGDSEVWTMAPDGSDPRNLSQHPNQIDGEWSVGWSPDGSRLVYASAPFAAPWSSVAVKWDLAAAEALLFAVTLALVAILLASLAAPFGSFTLVLTIIVGLSVAATERWGYLPAAILAGFLVDLLVRSLTPRRRTEAAAAALPALAVLAMGLTTGATGSLAWSLTLLLGVAVAAAMIGWGLAYAVERLFQLPGEGVVVLERDE